MKVSTPVNDCEKNTREQDNDIFDTLYATTHESEINPLQYEIDTIENRLGEINLLNIINNNDSNDDLDMKDIEPPILRRYTNNNTYDEIMELRLQYLNKQITIIGDKIDNNILLLQCKQKMKELEGKLEYLTELSK